jgi:hypothetical protein
MTFFGVTHSSLECAMVSNVAGLGDPAHLVLCWGVESAACCY